MWHVYRYLLHQYFNQYISQLDMTLNEDWLTYIKLLPCFPNSKVPRTFRTYINKKRPIGVVFLFLKTSDVQHCRLLIELFTYEIRLMLIDYRIQWNENTVEMAMGCDCVDCSTSSGGCKNSVFSSCHILEIALSWVFKFG